jgi:hypothetical protein
MPAADGCRRLIGSFSSCACDSNGRNSDAGLDQFDDLMGVVGVGFEFCAGQEAVPEGAVDHVGEGVEVEVTRNWPLALPWRKVRWSRSQTVYNKRGKEISN